MKKPHLLLALFLAASLHASPCSANFRPVRHWTYPELMQEADLVIIGVPAWTGAVKNTISDPRHERQLRTTIEVRLTMKGNPRLQSVSLTYLELLPIEGDPPGVIEIPGNGSSYLRLITKQPLKENAPQGAEPADPEYLFFLKQRRDGTYEPASGHGDPIASVKRIEPVKDAYSHRLND